MLLTAVPVSSCRQMAVTYTLGAKCVSEFVGSFIAIWLGESVIANELLGQTKVRLSQCQGQSKTPEENKGVRKD